MTRTAARNIPIRTRPSARDSQDEEWSRRAAERGRVAEEESRIIAEDARKKAEEARRQADAAREMAEKVATELGRQVSDLRTAVRALEKQLPANSGPQSSHS